MLLVVDANILFSALIKDSKTAKLLLFDKFILIAPDKLFDEFEKYKKEILSKTNRQDTEFSAVLSVFKNRIKLVPESKFKPFIKEANSISPDPDDIQYFALALKFNCPIWSNDKSLKQQSKVDVFNTKDLLSILL